MRQLDNIPSYYYSHLSLGSIEKMIKVRQLNNIHSSYYCYSSPGGIKNNLHGDAD